MKVVKYIFLLLTTLTAWSVFVLSGVTNGYLLRPLAADQSSEAFVNATDQLVKKEFVGNLVMTLLEEGEVANSYFYAEEQDINEYTIYQMASVSKWVSAWGVFTLIQKGKLDLDKPVSDYLTRWQLPQSDFDNNKVTVRRLLSHTAGLVDGLGYMGYSPDEEIQSIEESLTKASDAIYTEGVAKVGYEPGTEYRYSGAGYTLLQLLIEEASGLSFQDYMTQEVFVPLGMNHSTFVLSDSLDWQMATPYNKDASISEPYKFTALAAASLYTCAHDMTVFLKAHLNNNDVLTKESIAQMTAGAAFHKDVKIHGLGPQIFSGNDEKSNVIGHNGSNLKPQINTTARLDLQSKNGIIVMEMGSESMATVIGDEWLFQTAGIADYVVIQRNKSYLITLFAIGFILLIAIFILLFIKSSKPVKD